MTHWFERDRPRLQAEISLMRDRSRAVIRRVGDQLVWSESLVSPNGQRFLLAIEYPERFPYEAPRALILEPPMLASAPHRFPDGSLCLWGDFRHAAGPKTTAVAVRSRAIVWFFLYEEWQKTGVWNADEHGNRRRGA